MRPIRLATENPAHYRSPATGLLALAVLLLMCAPALAQDTSDQAKPVGAGKLTSEETRWLDEHPVIKLGMLRAEPYMIKMPSGDFTGIIADYYEVLGKRLGVRFVFVDDDWDNWAEVPGWAEAGTIDAIPTLVRPAAVQEGLLIARSPFQSVVTAFAMKQRQFVADSEEDLRGLRVSYFGQLLFMRAFFDQAGDEILLFQLKVRLRRSSSYLRAKLM